MFEQDSSHRNCCIVIGILIGIIVVMGIYIGIQRGDIKAANVESSMDKERVEILKEKITAIDEELQTHVELFARGKRCIRSGYIPLVAGTIVIPPKGTDIGVEPEENFREDKSEM